MLWNLVGPWHPFICSVILKFCTEHSSTTAMLCAKFQNNWQLWNKLWANEISWGLDLRCMSDRCPVLHKALYIMRCQLIDSKLLIFFYGAQECIGHRYVFMEAVGMGPSRNIKIGIWHRMQRFEISANFPVRESHCVKKIVVPLF